MNTPVRGAVVLLPNAFDYEERSYPLFMQGAGHAVSGDEPHYDPGAAVRAVAEEVTGKSFAPPARRMGFV